MKTLHRKGALAAAALAALALTGTLALAGHHDDDERHGERGATGMGKQERRASAQQALRTMPQIYKSECGSCHLAFEPRFLPWASWQRMMGSLEQHYGTDASLQADEISAINAWLQPYAGTYKRVAATPPPEDRITRSAWFERKHEEDLTPAVLRRASIKSAANCAACHRDAERGDFDDDTVKIPRR